MVVSIKCSNKKVGYCSAYYVLFLEYPAAYGVLNVVDRFCLKIVEVAAPQKGNAKQKRRNKRRNPKVFQNSCRNLRNT